METSTQTVQFILIRVPNTEITNGFVTSQSSLSESQPDGGRRTTSLHFWALGRGETLSKPMLRELCKQG